MARMHADIDGRCLRRKKEGSMQLRDVRRLFGRERERERRERALCVQEGWGWGGGGVWGLDMTGQACAGRWTAAARSRHRDRRVLVPRQDRPA